MAFIFEEKETYVFGKRKSNDTNNMNVEFTRSPEAVTLSGNRLLNELQIDNWEDYLKANPNSFKPTDTIVMTKLKDGDRLFITQGQPYSKKVVTEGANGLSDNGAIQVYKSNSEQITKSYQSQLRDYMARINQLEERVTQYQDQDIDNTKKILKLTAENKSLEIKLETITEQFTDYKERFGQHLQKAEEAQSLNDGLNSAFTAFGPVISLATQFAGQWFSQKLGGQPPQMAQPQQQQLPANPGQAQNNFNANPQETFL